MKNIYELDLHESIDLRSSQSSEKSSVNTVTRVPGGWIYEYKKSANSRGGGVAVTVSGVFVPLNDEFKTKGEFKMTDPNVF